MLSDSVHCNTAVKGCIRLQSAAVDTGGQITGVLVPRTLSGHWADRIV
jgi:hypothetical protein